MKCSNCGSELREGAKFCANCGVKIQQDEFEQDFGCSDEVESGIISHNIHDKEHRNVGHKSGINKNVKMLLLLAVILLIIVVIVMIRVDDKPDAVVNSVESDKGEDDKYDKYDTQDTEVEEEKSEVDILLEKSDDELLALSSTPDEAFALFNVGSSDSSVAGIQTTSMGALYDWGYSYEAVIFPSTIYGCDMRTLGYNGTGDISKYNVSDLRDYKAENEINEYDWLQYGCNDVKLAVVKPGYDRVMSIFKGNTSIERVVLPDTVTEIGSFANCSNMKKINIPSSVKRIGGFDNCPNLIVIVDENSYAKQYCEINGIEYELSGKQALGDNIVESLPDVQNEYKRIYFDFVAESLNDYDFAMLLDVLGDSTPELLMMEDNRDSKGGMLDIYVIDSWGDVNMTNISHIYKPTSEVYYINNDSESIWLVTDCQQETSMGLSSYTWRTDKCVSITQGTDTVSTEFLFTGEVRFHQTDHEEYVIDGKCRASDDGATYDSNKEDYFKWLSQYFDEGKSAPFDYNKMVQGKDAILAMLQN